MKIVVWTLGCKVNQYESDSLINTLRSKGHEVESKLGFADVYIINTCAVTNEAEKKSRQVIAKCKSFNKDAKVLVCGCASEKNTKQFSDIEGVTFVSGVANKLSIVDNLDKAGVFVQEHSLEYDDNYVSVPTKTRAYVKIQDGCNNFCSYCIIPYLRGRSRSRNVISVLNEIDRLSKQVKEIIITGIDVSDYKIDGEKALHVLLEKLEVYKDVRFRLSSLEQGISTPEFINTAKQINLCPHFHLSLQSGCDTVLKRMNRKYKTQDFLRTIKALRKNFDNPCITTDVIVGFPQETDKEFKQTYKFCKKVGFASMHIFPYSIRTGTVAERMKQVDGKVKKQRANVLEKLNKKLKAKYINSNKRKILTVLTEEVEDGFVVGHSENYIKCYLPKETKLNEFVQVKIEKLYKDGAICSLK